jgi:ribosomal protein L10
VSAWGPFGPAPAGHNGLAEHHHSTAIAGTAKPLKAGGLSRKGTTGPTTERPQCEPSRLPMKPIRLFSAVLFSALISVLALLFTATLIFTGPAFAADPIFPPGLRVGMIPLVGLNPAKTFAGFQTEDESVKVLVAELPAEAYGEVVNALKAGPANTGGIKPESIETAAGMAYYTAETAKNGTSVVRRYSMILSGGTFSGYVAVQVPENAGKIYSDEAVRAMFASAVIRKEVPVEEKLGLMPFKVSELSAFKNVRTLTPGAAVLLADGDETTGIETAPFMVIGLMGSAPAQPDDRSRFAEQAATAIPGVRNLRITMSEPVRIDGMAGYETRIDATSGKDNTPVTVVQWLRFGGGQNALRIIGSAPREQWTKAFPRFRAVRDGIQPH